MQKSGFAFMAYFCFDSKDTTRPYDWNLLIFDVGPPTCDTASRGRSACVRLRVQATKGRKREDGPNTWTFSASMGSRFRCKVVTVGRPWGESATYTLAWAAPVSRPLHGCYGYGECFGAPMTPSIPCMIKRTKSPRSGISVRRGSNGRAMLGSFSQYIDGHPS